MPRLLCTMPIRYSIKQNPVYKGKDNYYAQVKNVGVADSEMIAKLIVERGGTVSMADVQAVLTTLDSVCHSLLLDGYRLKIGEIVDLFPSIQGKFTGLGDQYSPIRHKILAKANANRALSRRVREKARVQKVTTNNPAPRPIQLMDSKSGIMNTVLTPGNIARISGSLLKYNPETADEGIFLIKAGARTGHHVEDVAILQPRELVFLVPELEPGEYNLEVRARMDGASRLSRGRLNATLVVH